MNTFKWPLLILLLCTGLALAAYLAGLFPDDYAPRGDIQVTLEEQGSDHVLRIRLDDTDTQTRWRKTGDRYSVDIRRLGPDLYRFNVALIDPEQDISHRIRGSARVGNQPVTLGGFTFPDGGNGKGSLRHDNIVIETH